MEEKYKVTTGLGGPLFWTRSSYEGALRLAGTLVYKGYPDVKVSYIESEYKYEVLCSGECENGVNVEVIVTPVV
jgi:hypothetical protein